MPPVGGDASFGTDAFDSVDALAARGHRATLYLRVLAYVVIANVALWLPVAVMMRATALAIVDVGLLVTGLGALWLTRLGHVHVARALVALCIFVAVALVVAIAYGDTGSEIRLANLWFIVLAVAAYFVFYDYRPLVRDTYALLAFGLFVAYAAGVGPRLVCNPSPSCAAPVRLRRHAAPPRGHGRGASLGSVGFRGAARGDKGAA